jgi:HTH-type transcriptional regulator/antitoxin HigA
LEPFIGTSGRVSEILNHKRPLTLNMIRKLNRGLGIPAEALINSANL